MESITRTSLHGFSKANDLAKSSVSRKAKELGIGTSNGLTDEDCDRLKVAFNVDKPQVIEAELEPDATVTQSSIQLLGADKLTALDSIANLASGLTVYKRPEIVLNGAQDEAVEMVTELAQRVVGMTAANDQREQALQERKQNLDKLQATVQQLAAIGKSQELRADDINSEAKTLAATESELKKQLAELTRALG